MQLSEEVIELSDLLEYYDIPKSNLNLTYLLLARNKGIDVIRELYFFDKEYNNLSQYNKQIKFREYFYRLSREEVE